MRNAAPAVWAVRDADTLLYITGTVHLLPDNLDWRNGPIVAAMADADALITELSPDELARVGKTARPFLYGTSSEAIAARFPAELRDDYAEIAGSLPAVPDMARLDDWAVALLLAQIVAARAGLEADNGMDSALIDAFADAGKPRSGLERAADQFGQFDAIPPAEQRRALTEMMRNIAEGMADDRLNATIDAWARGDMDALAAIIARDARTSPETYRLLLDVRNERWADQLAARMAKPGKLLVAVGAGHLAGPDSLIAKLAARGLKAERLR
jgi:uncharacterized protein YbaP (TraB family)